MSTRSRQVIDSYQRVATIALRSVRPSHAPHAAHAGGLARHLHSSPQHPPEMAMTLQMQLFRAAFALVLLAGLLLAVPRTAVVANCPLDGVARPQRVAVPDPAREHAWRIEAPHALHAPVMTAC
jgi:hypothetical protein